MTQSFLQSEDELFDKKFPTFPVEGDHSKFTEAVYFSDVEVLKAFIRASHARYLEHLRESNAYTVLKENQEQLDEEGIMVGVSRQALDELLALLANNE